MDAFLNLIKRVKSEKWYRLAALLMLWDFAVAAIAFLLALWLRFDCQYSAIPHDVYGAFLGFFPFYGVLTVVVFSFLRLYRSVWRFAGLEEMIRVILGCAITLILHFAAMVSRSIHMPLSYYVWGCIFQLLASGGIRFSYRFYHAVMSRIQRPDETAGRVMIIGAGSAGLILQQDLVSAKETNDKAVCFIDDDTNKHGRYIDGVPIVGGREEILNAVEKYKVDKIFLALPSASAEDKRDILNICQETGCKLMQLPGVYQFVRGDISIKAMKDVSVEDLLGREPIQADLREVFDFINDKVVLVTGGGGSIGSELCRQIAGHNPRQLIILDVYENNAYAIQLELKEKFPRLNLEVLIGSVRDSRRMFQVFERYRPQIVYHAAAHKHVPLMEDNPKEAVKNNVLGTYNLASAADHFGVKRFVMISTDKAVNPTNVMGATKRICEKIVQAYNSRSDTDFVCVRFGNVLGSSGSVIPLFKEQIEAGGPVTVTHPDIIRYFMMIPEAVSLVLQAGAYAKGGEIFILDMGQPVKIRELAENLIRLSGHVPGEDIEIKYTGLREGEKLYEELLIGEEGIQKTENNLIYVAKPTEIDGDALFARVVAVADAINGMSHTETIDWIKSLVPNFTPKNTEYNESKHE